MQVSLSFILQVGSQTSVVEMIPTDLQPSVTDSSKRLKGLQWDVFQEKAGIWSTADFKKNGLVDHINTTKDTTDYLWYTTRCVDNILLASYYILNYCRYSSRINNMI